MVIGSTSKWQSDGRNTLLAHGKTLDDSKLPVGAHWGVGDAVAQKFAREGLCVVLTTLVLQGMTLRPIMQWVGLKDDGTVDREIQLARVETSRAALQVLRGHGSGRFRSDRN